jgi:hypothetical protein
MQPQQQQQQETVSDSQQQVNIYSYTAGTKANATACTAVTSGCRRRLVSADNCISEAAQALLECCQHATNPMVAQCLCCASLTSLMEHSNVPSAFISGMTRSASANLRPVCW